MHLRRHGLRTVCDNTDNTWNKIGEIKMVRITAYLDGQTSGCGYKYVLTNGPTSWRAFRTARGLKRFLDAFGLKIDASQTELKDYRQYGKGRLVTMACFDKIVDDGFHGFYHLSEVPENAKPFIDLCNGSYVQCFVVDEGDKVTEYHPNPNSKEVYRPYDYREMAQRIG